MKKQEITLMTDYTDLYDEAKRRYEKLIKIRKSKEEALEKMPPGKIHISKTTKGVVEYYLRQDSKERAGKYIPKSEITTIRQYLQKAYDEMLILYHKGIRLLVGHQASTDEYVQYCITIKK